MKKTAWVALAIISLACSKQHPGGAGKSPAFLRLIPADTPYVFASLEPAPRAYWERSLRNAGPTLNKSLAAMRNMGFANKGPWAKMAVAFVEELSANLSPEGLERMGMGTEIRGALYGLGLVPVLRWEVKDAAKVRSFIAGVYAKAGVQVATAKLGEHEYWRFEVGAQLVAVVAVTGRELIATLAPEASLDRVLPLVFGDQKPARSLADSGALGKLIEEYGFGPWGAGWLDVARAAAILTEENAPERALLGHFAEAIPPFSPDCKREIAGLVGESPRMVFGLDEVSGTRTHGSAVLELRPETVAALSALRVPIPGLGEPLAGGVMSVGGGIDLPKAVDFLRAKVAMMKAAPFRCPLLAGVNEGVGELQREMGKALPGWLGEVRGGVLVLQELKAGDEVDVKAYALVVTADPSKLIALAKQLVPQFSGLNVSADGKAVTLPSLAPMLPTSWIAMRQQTLGLAMGEGMDGVMVHALSAPPAPDQPFFVFSFDAVKWNRLVSMLGDSLGDMTADESNGVLEFSIGVNQRGLVFSGGSTMR